MFHINEGAFDNFLNLRDIKLIQVYERPKVGGAWIVGFWWDVTPEEPEYNRTFQTRQEALAFVDSLPLP